MADVFSKLKRSQVMAAIKSRGNRETELRLAKILRSNGISGWRRNQPLLGKPDFSFREERVAVFVDGCFWHGCLKHSRLPRTNQQYWRKKFARNQARDRQINRELRRTGWFVLRVWQHELSNESKVVVRLATALGRKAKRVHKQRNVKESERT